MTLSENKKTIILIFLAFFFSVAVRMIWVYQFSDTQQFRFHNQFMINTNDGYWYAEGARDIISGDMNSHDLSAYNTAESKLTAFLVKILSFSFETIIFYMPVFFSSLIVIPIILIGRSIGKLEVGFIGALIGSIAWSYYNRTMIGYYDTDLLNIVFPTFLLWSLILALRSKDDRYLLFTAFEIIAYRWWYPQSYSLEFAFFGIIFIYFLYEKFKNKDLENSLYLLTLLTFMMFAMMWVDGYIRFVVVLALFVFLKYKKELFNKYIYHLFTAAVLLFLLNGGVEPIIDLLKRYVFTQDVVTVGENLKLNFFTVGQTIREAGKIPFDTFANRISGHPITFVLSIIGYFLMVYRYRSLLLGLPMIGLGFLAYSGGLRFTVYAVPVLALGIAFLIVEVAGFIKNTVFRYSLISFLTLLVLIPNINHVINYRVPTVFTKDEVNVLTKLKSIASRKDYVVGWWDYGYPIRYYADVRTLCDGNKHSGKVNFPVSFILTHPQKVSAKMLRLDVEYTEKRFDKDKNKSKNKKWADSNIGQMILDYGFKDPNKFLQSLSTDIKLPKKTRDIYLYLPNRMMNIYPTITLFSNIDLMTGEKKHPPFFYKTVNFKENNQLIDLGQGLFIDKKTNSLILGRQRIPIKRFSKTFYDKSGKLHKEETLLNRSSDINIVYMSNYHQFLVVDDSVYNSLYFQLFVFENYDKNLFQPVILTPLAKVYKLKD